MGEKEKTTEEARQNSRPLACVAPNGRLIFFSFFLIFFNFFFSSEIQIRDNNRRESTRKTHGLMVLIFDYTVFI